MTAIPEGSSAVSAMAGDTFQFTAWFRDIVGMANVSNFSNAVSVTFR